MCKDCMNPKTLLTLAVVAVVVFVAYKKGLPQKLISMVSPKQIEK